MTYYKWLDTGRTAHAGFQWPECGEWVTVQGEIIPCENGIHYCRESDLLWWINAELYTFEPDESEVVEHNETEATKLVCRRGRLVEQVTTWSGRTTRLFAADCAEHVLHLFEQEYPNDTRPREAIETARRYANGEVSAGEASAAKSAAKSAAQSAAWSAAKSAACAAAKSAAWSAARYAAWYAAWSAAEDAEREWQSARLLDYIEGRAG